MIKEKFFNSVTYGKILVTFYRNGEICGRFKMDCVSVDDFDDEIVIYGNENESVILDANEIVSQTDEDDEIEFLFGAAGNQTGITFLS